MSLDFPQWFGWMLFNLVHERIQFTFPLFRTHVSLGQIERCYWKNTQWTTMILVSDLCVDNDAEFLVRRNEAIECLLKLFQKPVKPFPKKVYFWWLLFTICVFDFKIELNPANLPLPKRVCSVQCKILKVWLNSVKLFSLLHRALNYQSKYWTKIN